MARYDRQTEEVVDPRAKTRTGMKRLTLKLGGNKVRLVLDLPAIDRHEDRLFLGSTAMARLRRFFRQSVPKAQAALDDGKFVISTDVSYQEHQGFRQVVLCRWKAGESVPAALEAADMALKEVRRLVKENQATARDLYSDG